jgi:hypothetical protein
MQTNIDVTGRILNVQDNYIEIAYLEDGKAKTLTIFGNFSSEFQLGDAIHYKENITMKRLSEEVPNEH